MLVPIVFAHGKGRLRESVIKCDPLSLIPVHHIVAPSPIAERLQLQQVALDVLPYARIGMGDIAERRIPISTLRPIVGTFLAVAALICRSIGDSRSHVGERLIRAADRPSTPVGIPEVSPARLAIPMIDYNVGHRLDSVLEQRLQRGAMFRKGAVAVVQSKIFFWVVARA